MPKTNHAVTSSAKQTIEPDTQTSSPLSHQDDSSTFDATDNWYSKLHPFGVPATVSYNKKTLNLSLFFRIWLAVAVIILVAGVVVFTQLFNHVRPISQQVIEDTLVDTAKVLAVTLQPSLVSGQIKEDAFQAHLDHAFAQNFSQFELPKTPNNSRYFNQDKLGELSTWYQQKTHSSFRVYVTDATGKVVYDSLKGQNNAEGADYSQWNDVYLTLTGAYGARTTRRVVNDENSSVMYVAQPITNGKDEVIGVVSVGKPTATIVPYLDATRQRMLVTSIGISLVALMLAGLVAWWLQQSMRLVTRYTRSLAQDAKKPYFYLGRELNELTDTIGDMKLRLENRAYVTDYVHTLTHELKSPLTAIRASGELLEATDLDDDDRQMLSHTITEQSVKLQQLIDRLLLLAKIEQPTFRLTFAPVDISELLKKLSDTYRMQCMGQKVSLTLDVAMIQEDASAYAIPADEFWLTQALQNILDNAVYFAQSQVVIKLKWAHQHIRIEIFNDGALIPDFALSKVFERYFSLSHQTTTQLPHKKGTGLGLPLVKQVVQRHGGMVQIANIESYDTHDTHEIMDSEPKKCISSGVLVTLSFPL